MKLIFHSSIPRRKIKYDNRQPQWMTNIMKINLKKRSKLTKIYFKNAKTESDLDNWIKKQKTYLRGKWKTEWLPHCPKNVLDDTESFLKQH